MPLYNYRIQEEKLTSVAHEVMTMNSSSEGLEFEPTYGNFPKIQNCIINGNTAIRVVPVGEKF